MTKTLRLAASLCLAGLAALALQAGAFAGERAPLRRVTVADADSARVIVRFKESTRPMRALAVGGNGELRQAQALSQRIGVTLADGHSIDARTQVMRAAGMSSQALAQRLAADPEVESVSVDKRRHLLAAPNDPRYAGGQTSTPVAGQWYLRTADSTLVSAINAEAAWDVSTGSASVVVAVLDTGVRADHPDLAGKLLPGYDFIAADSEGVFTTANDGDGRDSDPSDPGDWESGFDSSWHGTQTAGLVGAATNNGIGMASIGRGVMVLPLRVLGVGGGWDSDIQAAMRWAAGLSVPGVAAANPNPAKVINMSLGSADACDSSYQTLVNTLTAAGVVVVVSAGNDGLAVNSPANCSGVVAVAGVRHTGTKVGYSSLGSQVTISAPAGNCVNEIGTCLYPLLTTSNSGTTTPGTNIYTGGGDNASIGTSFSAPLVSGTLGLMFSVNASLTPAQAISMLKSSARAFPSTGAGAGVSACQAPTSVAQDSECYCTTSTCGAGLLDAGAAVAQAAGVTALITPSASSAAIGTAITLSASGSSVSTGRTIASYLWTITSGAGIASFSSAADAAAVTLATTAAGSVTVRLTVTDSAGSQGTASQTLTITDPNASTPQSSGGGGGGALGAGWLLLIGAAVVALGRGRLKPQER